MCWLVHGDIEGEREHRREFAESFGKEEEVRTGNESAAAVQEAAETVLDNWPRVVENVREARSPRDNTLHAVS
ncbi:hypothetical protein HZH68_004699 [Vespula germanica]|uniref:Uncharacterized protein n=1 Tax=Vespula germanica TaxID=30212 RepID=A0A834KPB1_VESGE|nr:hypothetical protein HZH68_004699 [Vespula germanica]